MTFKTEELMRTASLGIFAALFFVTASLVGHVRSSHAQSVPGQVTVEYVPEQTQFSLHEPVVVTFSVHNDSARSLLLTLGAQGRQFFQFSLTTPDGRVLPGSFLPKGEVPNSFVVGTGKQAVPARHDYHQILVMNQWFEFPSPGIYFLTAKLTTDIQISGNGTIAPEVRNLRIVVGPRNPVHLQKVCEKLTHQIQNAGTFEQGRNPALQLSYVQDPIAVPYIARALSSNGSYDYLLVPGLRRIGDYQAVQALLIALNDKYGGVAKTAQAALHEMAPGIADPVLRARVAEALRHNDATRAVR